WRHVTISDHHADAAARAHRGTRVHLAHHVQRHAVHDHEWGLAAPRRTIETANLHPGLVTVRRSGGARHLKAGHFALEIDRRTRRRNGHVSRRHHAHHEWRL